jgi:hypothetical protein
MTKWRIRRAEHVALRNAYKIMVGKPEGKKPPERPRRDKIILKLILRK